MRRYCAASAGLLLATALSGCGVLGHAAGAVQQRPTPPPSSLPASPRTGATVAAPHLPPSPANAASTRSVWARAHIPKAWVETCIPRSDHYVMLRVPTPRSAVSVQIGHPLTTQGVGIPTTTWTFPTKSGIATVPVPTDVAFTLHANGFLMGDVVDAQGSLRLLFWGSAASTPVLRGGPLSLSALGTWSLSTMTLQASAIQSTLKRDEHLGWGHRLDATHDVQLVGEGKDAWLPLPMGASFDLFQANGTGGNVIFTVDGISNHVPSAYTPRHAACPVQ